MDVALGGRVAEELIFGSDKITTGRIPKISHYTCTLINLLPENLFIFQLVNIILLFVMLHECY